MTISFERYGPTEQIPVLNYLKNKKMNKYYNRETAAGIVCFSKLEEMRQIAPGTPAYYATGVVEHEDFGLAKVVDSSMGEDGGFSQRNFVENGMQSISPLTQFKVLYNMPLSFISIEKGLTGDNAVVYASARALVDYALHSPIDGDILIGAGKVYADGSVESGFALVDKSLLAALPVYDDETEAIEIFKYLAPNGGKLNE